MSDVKPILFSGPMVRALLDGRKTQTRRVLKPQPPKDELGYEVIGTVRGPEWYHPAVVGKDGELEPGKQVWGVYDDWGEWGARVPYMPGDLLWVREKAYYGPNRIAYAADNVPIGGRDRVEGWGPARSSIHMPRWASRLTLEVTSVKVERLQEISEADAQAEGTPCYVCGGPMDGLSEADCHCFHRKATPHDFRNLWNSLNAKRGYGWEANPWVCAIAFNVHKMNVDAFLAQREAA